MSRLDTIRARAQARDSLPRHRANPPAPKRPGDELGRIARAPGVGRDEAITAAKLTPWWPRVRGYYPHGTNDWWWWALKPAGSSSLRSRSHGQVVP